MIQIDTSPHTLRLDICYLTSIMIPDFEDILGYPITSWKILHQRPTHTLYHITTSTNSYILKSFLDENALEPRVYALLISCGVTTLPLYAHTNCALLLEDLHSSTIWRLANEGDLESEKTGIALAEWYRTLHQAGRQALSNDGIDLSFLKREIDDLNSTSLHSTGKILGLAHLPGWTLAIKTIDSLTTIYRSLPHTFNYNDFAAENLAVSLGDGNSLRALVFDYDCFGIGLAYSDWRNATYSLRGQARGAFAARYGMISQAEKVIDEPLSLLYNLVVASTRQELPHWVKSSINSVFNGELEKQIRMAIEDMPSST
jgi:hypothetical protein